MGEYETLTIGNIDKVNPTAQVIGLPESMSTDTDHSLKVTVTMSDTGVAGKSDIKLSGCKWKYVKSEATSKENETKLGTNASSYTNAFTQNGEEITLSATEAGKYYLHILVEDIAENKYEIIQGPITVTLSARTVTYNVNTNVTYSESIRVGASALSPTTFTPAISGWTFVGWREDTTASSTVLTSKTVGEQNITLYAVFKQQITLTYYNNTTTKATTSKDRYYNNGTVVNPKFSLTAATKSGYTFRGWSTATAANPTINYSNISNTEFTSSATVYGCYYKQITLSTVVNGTKTSTKGNIYYNSSGNTANPTFTVNNPNGGSYKFCGWTTSNSIPTTWNFTPTYSSIKDTTFTSNTTLYALFEKAMTYIISDRYSYQEDHLIVFQPLDIEIQELTRTEYKSGLTYDDDCIEIRQEYNYWKIKYKVPSRGGDAGNQDILYAGLNQTISANCLFYTFTI